MKLRDYQSGCIEATHKAWETHNRVMNVLPTGMGKTEIFVDIARQWSESERDNNRTLVIANTRELVEQAARKIYQRTGVSPGVEMGQSRSNEYAWGRSEFVVGSKQTLTGRGHRYTRFKDVGLVIVDECHGAATKPYKEMVDYFVDQGAKILGKTATPKRHDGKAMANLFDTCAFEMYIADAVPLGWLCPPVAQCIQIQSLDLSEVGTKGAGGDFKDGELAKAMEQEKVVFEIAEVTARESVGLKTVVFCATVAEARAVAHRLVDRHGVRADWVCGDERLRSKQDRAEVLRSFTEDPDGIQIVTNVGVLTTGWDFPGLGHIVMGRPTKSPSLYTQIFGRGTRPLPGVVDFEGSTAELRRQAIATSAKPHFKVTDLYDNSLEHKLVGSFDVMAGSMGLEVIKKAQDNALGGGPVDVDKALADAKQQLDDEKDRKRRAAVASAAKYQSVDVDPLNPNQLASGASRHDLPVRMNIGRFKGKLLQDVPDWFLRWGLRKGAFRAAMNTAVKSELIRRKASSNQPAPKPTAQSIDDVNAMLLER
ncbi:MAG: DEAD/DEAH box helicase [Planctomycetota bacterium]